MLADTTAKRIEPSGQVVLTSVCVGKLPSWREVRVVPCGNTRPNVAHPEVRRTVARGLSAGAGWTCAVAAVRRTRASRFRGETGECKAKDFIEAPERKRLLAMRLHQPDRGYRFRGEAASLGHR